MAKDALDAVADGSVEIETLGEKVIAEMKDGELYVGGAKVFATDIMVSNGVVHGVEAIVEAAEPNSEEEEEPAIEETED